MGTFKEPSATTEVSRVLVQHYDDFVKFIQEASADETVVLCADAVERKHCPQSLLMLAEMFQHFFDYSDASVFISAVEKKVIDKLLELLHVYPLNSYLHWHVLESCRRLIDRNQLEATKTLFDKTELLNMLRQDVHLVRIMSGV